MSYVKKMGFTDEQIAETLKARIDEDTKLLIKTIKALGNSMKITIDNMFVKE